MSGDKLSTAAFEAARTFINTSARPLEVACFGFHFEDGPTDAVFEALLGYQNRDGGFGHGLESDVRAPESSAICTTVAFQLLNDMPRLAGLPQLDAILAKAAAYLQDTFDADTLHWRIIPKVAAGSPRAPWWHEGGRANEFDEFSLNPTAEVLGLLYRYESSFLGKVVSDEVRTKITEKVVQTVVDSDEIEMHDLFCCLRLANSPNLPSDIAETLQQKLSQLTIGTVVTDLDQWSGYGLRPLDVVDGPDSPFMVGLEEAVSANLDYISSEQNEDGAWIPTWTWGDLYPDAWEQAKIEWAGVITLKQLRTLQKFGRIDE